MMEAIYGMGIDFAKDLLKWSVIDGGGGGGGVMQLIEGWNSFVNVC